MPSHPTVWFARLFPVVALAVAIVPAPARAATLTWGTSGTGGSGTWDTSTAGWWNGTADVVWNNGNNDVASFGGTAGTVTLTTDVTANGVSFATDGYLLTGGTITLGGGTPTFTANSTVSATVASVVAGGTLTKQGAGTLVLSGANTYFGGTELLAGTLAVPSLSGIGSGYLAVKNGATFSYAGSGAETTTRTLWLDSGLSIFDVANASGSLTLTPGGGSRNQPFTKSGAGTLTFGNDFFSGSNTVTTASGTLVYSTGMSYSGTTAVTGGYLRVNSTLRSTAAVTVSGGTAEFGAVNVFVSGHGQALSPSMVLTASGAGSTILFNGSMDSRIGNVVLADGGTLTSNRGLGGYDVLLANVTTGAATVTVSGNAAATMNGSGGIHLQGVQNFDVADVTASSAADLTVSMALGDPGLSGGSAGGINKTGAGTMVLTNSGNNFTGNITIAAGTLEVAGSGRLNNGSYSGAITNNGALVFTTGADNRILGPISGTGGITMSSNAALYMSGTSTYSGTTTIGGGGYLEVNGNTPLSIANSVLNLTSSNGTRAVDIWGGKLTVRGLTGTGILLANGASGVNFSGVGLAISTPAGESYSFGGSLRNSTWSGASLIVEKTGDGTQILTGNNTYSGGTLITAGTVVAAASGAVGGGGTITLNTASTNASNTSLFINATGGNVTVSRPITVAAQGTGTATLGSASTANNNIASFGGAVALQKDVRLDGGTTGNMLNFTGGIGGTGNVTVVGTNRVVFMTTANTYGGSTTIDAGAILQLSDGSVTSTSFLPDGTVLTANGTLNLAKGANSETIGGLAGSGTVQGHPGVGGVASALEVNGGQSQVFSGVLADGGAAGATLSFTKSGSGLQILTGNNTYTGATTITGGTLQLGNGGATGSIPGNPAVSAGAALAFRRSDAVTYSGIVGGAGNLVQLGSGTLTLAAANTYSGTTVIAGGVLALGTSSALGGGGNLTFSGGLLQYTAANTADYAARIRNSSAAVAIDTNGRNVTFAGAVDSTNASGLTKLGSGTLTLTAANSYTGNTTISAGVLRLGTGGSVAGPMVNNATLLVDRTDAFTLSNAVSGSGDLVQAGSGTTTLAGANSYSGSTRITGGVLSVSQETNLGVAPGSATPGSIVIDGGSLLFTGGFTLAANRGIALGPASGSGSGTIDVASGQTLEYGGVIANNGAGAGGLVKAGAGALNLTASPGYAGNTSIDAGTLQLGAGVALASPAVTVAPGAALSGRGTVNALTVASGGVLAPGIAGSGTLTTGDLTFSGSATVTMGVSPGGLPTNLLSVLGGVTTSGGANSVVFAFGSNLGLIDTGTYSLLTYTGALSDTSAFLVTGGTGGRQTVSVDGTTVGTVSLVVGNASLIWTGTDGTGWFTSGNWNLSSTGSAATFENNDTVVFNDLATSGTVVISGSNATPSSVTFAGTTKGITVEGAGGFGISTGALVKSGSALVTISSGNSFDGGTTLSAGRVRVGDDAALGTGAITVNGPAALSSDSGAARTLANGLNLGADVTLGDAADTGPLTVSGTVTFGGGSRTITTPSNVTLSGPVINGGLSKAGAGTLTLTASNAYAAGTTLSAGTLRVGNDAALGSGGVTLADGVTLASDSTTARTLANAFTLTGNVTLGSAVDTGALSLGLVGGVSLGGGTRQVTTPSNVTFAGPVTNGGLAKFGPGTLTLAAANSYSGGTTLAAGGLALGNAAALGSGTLTLAAESTVRTALTGTIANAVVLDPSVTGTFDTQSGAAMLSGVVSGAGALVKTGAGTLGLAGANTFAGGVTLSAGQLNLNNASALGTGPLTIAGVSTIDNTSGGPVTLAGNVQAWNADFTFAGSNPLNLGAGAVTLGGNRQVTVTSSTLTVGGPVGGGFALTKTGAGTLVLSSANGYSGGTTLTAGTLLLGNASALGGGPVALDGGTLDVGGLTVGNDVVLGGGAITSAGGTLAGVVSDGAAQSLTASNVTFTGTNTYTGVTTITGGTVTLGGAGQLGAGTYAGAIANAGTLAVATSANQTLSGGISGTGALAKSGAGTLTLSASNAFSGGVTLSAGRLNVDDANVLGTGRLTLAGGTLGNTSGTAVTVAGNIPQTWSGNFTFAGPSPLNLGTGAVTITASRTVTVTSSTLTVGSALGGGVGITKAGAGTLALTGVSNYSGSTTVGGGTLVVGPGGVIYAGNYFGGPVVTVNGGGTLDLRNWSYDQTNNTQSLGGLRAAADAIVVDNGTIRISGTVATSYGRGVTVNSGGATLEAGPGADWTINTTTDNTNWIYNGNPTITLTGGGTGTFQKVLGNGSGGLVKSGSGTWTILGVNTFSGPTTVNAGTLNVSAATGALQSTSSFTVNAGATANIDSTNWLVTGHGIAVADGRVITVDGGTIVFGSGNEGRIGNVTLANGGTFTSNRGLASFDVLLGNVSSGSAATVAVSGTVASVMDGSGGLHLQGVQNFAVADVTGDGTVDLTVSLVLGDAGAVGGTGGVNKTGAGTMLLTGANTFTGNVTVAAGTVRVGGAGSLGNGSYAGTIANNAVLDYASSANQTLSGAISGTGTLVKTGAGTLVLAGANTSTGDTTISSGTLVVGPSGLLGGGAYAGTIANDAVLVISATANQVLSGPIAGTGSLVKNGAGRLTLAGVNASTGPTTVDGGALAVNGLITSSAVTVNAGATLGGSGTTADVTLAPGATVAPGNGPGLLTVATMTWSGSSAYDWQMYDYQGGEGAGWDSLLGTGTLTVNATAASPFTVNLLSLSGTSTAGPAFNWSQTTSGSFRLASFAGGITLADPSGTWWSLNTAGFSPYSSKLGTFSLATGTNDLYLVYTYTPPPAYVWTGASGSSALWSDGANWDSDPDIPTGTPSIVFAGSGGTSTNDITSGTGAGEISVVTSLTFSGSATGSYAVDGNAFTLGTLGIGNQSAFPQTVQNGITLAGAAAVDAATAALLLSGTVDTAGFTLSVTGSSGTTLASVVTGSGGLYKLGTGTLLLTGANDYTGGTTITSGTVLVGDGGTAGVLPGNVVNDGTLVFDRSDDVTYAGAISGAGSVTKLGGATLTLTADSTSTGPITIAGGTLRVGVGGATGAIAGDVANGGAIVFDRSSNLTYGGIVSGAGSVTKAGTGTLTLSGSQAYTGSTIVSGGTLALSGAGDLASSSGVDLSAAGAALDVSAASGNRTIASLAGVAGSAVALGGNGLTVLGAANTTVAGVISGSGSFTKAGAGTLTLSGSNTFTGQLTVSQGTLAVPTLNAAGTAGPLGSNAGAVVLGGSDATAVIALTGAGASTNRPFTLAAGGTGGFSMPAATTLTLSAAVAGSGGLAKEGGGTLALTAANTFAGPITIASGTLEVGGSGSLGNGTYTNTITNDGTLLLTTNIGTQRLFGPINGTGGITSTMSGALYMGGTYAYSGTTTIGGSGYFEVSNESPLSIANSVLNITSSNGSRAVDIWAGKLTVRGLTGTGILVANGAYNANPTWWFNSDPIGLVMAPQAGETYTFAGSLRNSSWNGAAFLVIEKDGAGTQILTGANTYSGGTLITGGTLAFVSGGLGPAGVVGMTGGTLRWQTGNTQDVSARTVLVDGLPATFDVGANDVTFATGLSDIDDLAVAAPVVKLGAGTLTLAGANLYTGDTTIASGTLALGGAGTLAGGNYAGTVTNEGVFAVATSASQTLSGTLAGTGRLVKSGAGTLTLLNATNDFSGGSTISGGIVSFATGALGTTGAVTVNGGTLRWEAGNTEDVSARLALVNSTTATLDTNGNDVTFASGLGGGTTAALAKAGAGTLSLAAATAYSGLTAVTGGTLALIGPADIGSSSGLSLTASGAAFDIAGASGDRTIGSLAGAEGSAILLGANNLTATVAANATFAGSIAGAGGFTKTGAGSLVLSGNNGYTGPTTITTGTLEVGGSGVLGGGSYPGAIANAGALRFTTSVDQTLSGPIDGAGSLVKGGAGTLTLSASNGLSGPVALDSGTLVFAAGALGGGTTTLNGGSLRWDAGNTEDVSARLALVNATTATLDTNGNAVTLAGGLGAGTSANLTKIGAGTLTLSGSNGYTGATSVNEGTLAIAGSGNIASSPGVSIATGATLDIAGASGLVNVGTLTGDGNVTLGGNTLRTAVVGESIEFNGVISGSGGFTKAGPDNLRLTAAQAFTGSATVEAGTLVLPAGNELEQASTIAVLVSGVLDTPGLTIVLDQTLAGRGTVYGDVAFAAGGILSPGGSVGTLTNDFGSTTWSGEMHYLFEVNDATGTPGSDSGWDLYNVTGDLTLAADVATPIIIDLTSLSGTSPGFAANFDENATYRWLIADAGSEITTFDPLWFSINTAEFLNLPGEPGRFSVVRGDTLGFGNDQLYVVYAAIPEPGTLALAAIGLAVAGWAFRRRRSTCATT